MNRNDYRDIVISIGLQNLPLDTSLNNKASYFEAAADAIENEDIKSSVETTAKSLRNADKKQMELSQLTKKMQS